MTACGATSIDICSTDTDVLVLAICHYPALCRKKLVTGTGKNHQTTQLRQVCDAIGPEKAAAMAALHGLSGSYDTCSLAGKGKHSSRNAFELQMIPLSQH